MSEMEVQELLDKAGKLKKENDKMLEATGQNYNFFRVLGIQDDEVIFSRMISNLLNINAAHGFKSAFLNLFIEEICPQLKLDDYDLEKAIVIKEKDIGEVKNNSNPPSGGRIDILLELPEKSTGKIFALIIENKIYAKDQKKQLLRYKTFGDSKKKSGEYADYVLIYLTLYGTNPSEISTGIKEQEKINTNANDDSDFVENDLGFWINCSYKNDILKWLQNCKKHTEGEKSCSLLDASILQFINQIKSLTGQGVSKLMELQEIIKENETNISNAELVYKNYIDIKKQIKNSIIRKLKNIPGTKTENKRNGDCNIKLKKEQWKHFYISYYFTGCEVENFKICIVYNEPKKAAQYDTVKNNFTNEYLSNIKGSENKFVIDSTNMSIWRKLYKNTASFIFDYKNEDSILDEYHQIVNAIDLAEESLS